MTNPVKNAYWVISDKPIDSNDFVHPEFICKQPEMNEEEIHEKIGKDIIKIISDSWVVDDRS